METNLALGAAVLVAFAAGAAVTYAISRRPRTEPAVPPPTATVASSSTEGTTQLIDQLDVGIVRLGTRLEVVSLNRAAARMLQVDQERVVGRSLMEVFVDHRVEEAARTALVEGSTLLEITKRTPDERRLMVRCRRAAGPGLWLLLEDVTELRRLQRIRTEFIDNLSHELRTPLTTIRLLTETLTQELARPDVDVPPRIRERILKIDVETGHLVQMVNELLDLSRIEGGAAVLDFDYVRIGDVINGAIERLRTFADRQRVGLEADVADASLPLVWADEERIGQVLVNLLHNAVKFSPPDSLVTVTTEARDGVVAVHIRDQGPGIARKDVDRIFERFYKVDKARQRGQGGTGLGLAIARHIVEGHGGQISVESQEGSGATFTFTVPVRRPA